MTQLKRILLTAATEAELGGVRSQCDADRFPNLDITCICTGVGMVNTALNLAESLSTSWFNLAINIGIAGSFDPEISIGHVVQVSEDRIAWFGAEDRNGFLPAEELGLCNLEEVVTKASHVAQGLPEVKGLTVNMAHGSPASIRRAMRQYAPQVESMEGAAFLLGCAHFATDALQVRAISNLVEPRNRDAWNIPLALNNLAAAVIVILDNLNDGD